MFIVHLSKSNIESINVEPSIEPVNEMVELEVDPNISKTIEIVPENRNVVINPQKYTRTVLNDECKCE